MYFKFKCPLLLLAVSLPAVLAKVPHGVYRITNVDSRSTVRSYVAEEPLYVSSTRENPGPFELWVIQDGPDGAQTIESLGLGGFVDALPESQGVPVVATHKKIMPTLWAISAAGKSLEGRDIYTIQANNKDLLWNVEPPVVPRGDVSLRGANGKDTQRFVLDCANCNLDDEKESKGVDETETFERLLGQVLSQVGHDLLDH